MNRWVWLGIAFALAVGCSSNPSNAPSSSSSSSSSGSTGGAGEGGMGGAGGSVTGGMGGMGGTSSSSSSGTGGMSGSSSSSSSSSSGSGGSGVQCPPPGPMDCSPGPGSGNADQCFDTESCFYTTVRNSVTAIVNIEHPEWIDWADGNPLVLQPEAYMDAVVAKVGEAGLCAIRDPNAGDEIAVKYNNDYAENFDILTSTGYARWGNGIFTSTCAPAWF